MKKIHAILGAIIATFLIIGAIAHAGQVDRDTYKKMGSYYNRSDGWYLDSSYNLHQISNGSTVANFSTAGALSVSGGITSGGAVFNNSSKEIAAVTTIDNTYCGQTIFVTAGIDTATITLPATGSFEGCRLEFIYNGADGGALVDISPNASDAIHGSCTLAASVLEFSGTDDADIGLTKATSNTGDRITLVGDGVAGWYVAECAGIWANN